MTTSLALAPLLLSAAAAASGEAIHRVFRFEGLEAGELLGHAVAMLGDLDGDGFGDFAVSAPAYATESGRVDIRSGRTGLALRSYQGLSLHDHLGSSLAALGDVDLDGVPDYAVSAPDQIPSPTSWETGAVWIGSGATGAVLALIPGDELGQHFGTSLAGGSDLDQDGRPDLVVGAPTHDGGGLDRGKVQAYSSATWSVLWSRTGPIDGGRLGLSLALVPDTDGDGAAEIAAGAPWTDVDLDLGGTIGLQEKAVGRLELLSGSNGAPRYALQGLSGYDFLGISAAGLGDVDLDDSGDFALGASDPLTGSLPDFARVISGSTGALLQHIANPAPNEGFARAVGSAGDLNGDGRFELAIGAPGPIASDAIGPGGGTITTAVQPGLVRIYAIGSAVPLLRLRGEVIGDYFGLSLAPMASDVDGDGAPDLIVGAPNDGVPFVRPGAAYLMSSAALSLSSSEHELSLGAGGAQALAIRAGPSGASALFLALGGAGPASAGWSGAGLPFGLDAYSLFTLQAPAPGPMQPWSGVLDPLGSKAIAFSLPSGAPASLAGVTLVHAAVVWPASGPPFATRAAPLSFSP